jgi:hypothetical protein
MNRRFILGFIFGVSLGVVTLLIMGALIPRQVSPVTASNFFFAATGVNATLLVAISVTIPTILSKTPDLNRRSRMLFLMAQLMVVFLGLVVSGIGVLVFDPTVPVNYDEFLNFVNITFTTWVVSFVLLVSGIWVSSLPEHGSKT